MRKTYSDCIDCLHCSYRELSVFNNLNDKQIVFLQDNVKHISLKKGDLLFSEGQFASAFYIIRKGKVKISKLAQSGKEQILRIAKEGDIAGYRVSKDTYTCNATAINDAHLCRIKYDTIHILFKTCPELAMQYIQLLSKEIINYDTKLISVTQKSMREQVAETILLLAEKFGMEEDGATINLVITRKEFANIIGTIRETATRFIYEFDQSHIIELSNKKIKIIDKIKLHKIANS